MINVLVESEHFAVTLLSSHDSLDVREHLINVAGNLLTTANFF